MRYGLKDLNRTFEAHFNYPVQMYTEYVGAHSEIENMRDAFLQVPRVSLTFLRDGPRT